MALERYVQAGGTLVLLASQPFPLYYAMGPGTRKPDPLTGRLGLPLAMAIEGLPAERLSVRIVANQVLTGLSAAEFPYPSIDPRLRSIDRQHVASDTKYTAIATVKGATRRDYGDAAGLVELPGGGRILYVASILQHDPQYGFAFLEAAYRFAFEAAAKQEQR